MEPGLDKIRSLLRKPRVLSLVEDLVNELEASGEHKQNTPQQLAQYTPVKRRCCLFRRICIIHTVAPRVGRACLIRLVQFM